MRAEIKSAALRQLRAGGAGGVSVRDVARELGMVPSAVASHFPGRDELLKALAADAQDELADVVQAAAALSAEPARRWRDAWHAFRGWGLAHPQEYALVYGTPGRPTGARLPALLVSVAARAGRPADGSAEPDGQVGYLTRALGGEAPPPGVAARVLLAWSQLVGLVSFEVFGLLAGGLPDNERRFDQGVRDLGRSLGLG